MDFPADEHAALQERLRAGQPIYTTRIGLERRRYHPGMIVSTPFGQLQVIWVHHISNLGEHPFLTELTKAQKAVLVGHRMAVIRLESFHEKDT